MVAPSGAFDEAAEAELEGGSIALPQGGQYPDDMFGPAGTVAEPESTPAPVGDMFSVEEATIDRAGDMFSVEETAVDQGVDMFSVEDISVDEIPLEEANDMFSVDEAGDMF
ncbi:MAG: hypothetical protein JHC87_00665, partial [Thermoleophilaceae bacterium]|nr:hypothetical protein [Thermoleophilaceae bacterium]